MANGQTPVYPHMPKIDAVCVRLMIDFSNCEEMLDFARKSMAPVLENDLHIYKVTAAQWQSVPVGNLYIVSEGGGDDMRLTKGRIATAHHAGDRAAVDVIDTHPTQEEFQRNPEDRE